MNAKRSKRRAERAVIRQRIVFFTLPFGSSIIPGIKLLIAYVAERRRDKKHGLHDPADLSLVGLESAGTTCIAVGWLLLQVWLTLFVVFLLS